jgi:hypothetical protein
MLQHLRVQHRTIKTNLLVQEISMEKAKSKTGSTTSNHMPQDVRQHTAGGQEKAGENDKETADLHAGGDVEGAGRYAQTAQGHAIHAAMHWIDPQSLPETSGILTKMLFNVHGYVDGFLLDDERQVHFPPHMSDELVSAVKVGEKVKVHGVKPRSVNLLVAASITSASGKVISDHGRQPNKI